LIVLSLLFADIPFETENDLRAKGTSRTPDILFSYPVAVKVRKKIVAKTRQLDIDNVNEDSDYDWRMICWIDSKVRKCTMLVQL
jgi:hypothetical protein